MKTTLERASRSVLQSSVMPILFLIATSVMEPIWTLAINLVNWLSHDDNLISINPRPAPDTRLESISNGAACHQFRFSADTTHTVVR